MTSEALAPDTPEAILEWEAANHRRAGILALIAGMLTVIGGVITNLARSAVPAFDDKVVTLLDGLDDMTTGTPIPPGRGAAQLHWIGDHPTGLVVGAVLVAAGAVLIYPAMAYLYRATKSRRPMLSRFMLIALGIGVVAFTAGTLFIEISRVIEGRNLAADASNRDALDAVGGGGFIVGSLLLLVGQFALGLSFVVICLNAMRAGLLTRFMGILGMIVGATFILPLDQIGIIRGFWLGALGALVLGRWPNGTPPAWTTGKEVPWPSSSRIRGPAAPQPVPETPAPTLPPADGLSAGQRRKRRKKK